MNVALRFKVGTEAFEFSSHRKLFFVTSDYLSKILIRCEVGYESKI